MILTALDATSITSCKNVIQAFMDNKEIFVGLFRHAKDLYRESIPMLRIVISGGYWVRQMRQLPQAPLFGVAEGPPFLEMPWVVLGYFVSF